MPLDPLPGLPPRQPADGTAGISRPNAVGQVADCRRWVAELQASLALLAERCGGLEEAHDQVVSSQNRAVPRLQELATEHAKIMAAVHQLASSDEVKGGHHAGRTPNQDLGKHTYLQEEPPRCGAGAALASPLQEEPLPPRQSDANNIGGLRFHDVQAVGSRPAHGGNSCYASTAAPSTQAEALPVAVSSNATASSTVPEPEQAAMDASAAAAFDVWARHHPSRGNGSAHWWNGSAPASPRPTCENLSTPGSGTVSSTAPTMGLPPSFSHPGLSAAPCSLNGSAGGLTEPIAAVQWPSMENWWQPAQSSFAVQPTGAMQFPQPLHGCSSWPSNGGMFDRMQPPPLPPLAPSTLNGWAGGVPPLSFGSAGVRGVPQLLQ